MEMRPQDGLSGLPHNTAVKQQQLPACRLHLWAPGVLSAFFAIGLVCLGLGIILILSAKNVKEIEINCTKICANCAELQENASNFDKERSCTIHFCLSEKMQGNVYQKLYGFYQNLHRYTSRSDSQLLGKDIRDVKNCSPFEKSHNGTPITPCGAVADSMFNDTIILSYNLNSSIHIQVSMLRSGITWWTDKYVKFKNPSSSNLSSAFAGTTKPPGWPKPVYDLDEEDLGNNGFVKDDFIVCMRAAAFPTFKKLYHCLSQIQYFIEGLPAGNYSFHITYITRFQGRKAVVLSTLMWSGGSGLFLGLAYSVTGAMKWLAFFLMMPVHLRMKKRKTFFLQQ
ncbi:LOW QUALITY PROTEIN: cell cycle control protein 50C-like [Dugong dugon]